MWKRVGWGARSACGRGRKRSAKHQNIGLTPLRRQLLRVCQGLEAWAVTAIQHNSASIALYFIVIQLGGLDNAILKQLSPAPTLNIPMNIKNN
jgi:hypothetical protein